MTAATMNEGDRGVARPQRRPALELRRVVKEYPGDPPVRALDDVSLRIDHGELVAIVGASGSGKSTLLNVMGTLDRPTQGVVEVDGVDTAGRTDDAVAGIRARKIGFVFQQFFLLPGMSAVENVANGLLYQGVAPSERRARAIDALESGWPRPPARTHPEPPLWR
jgi:putative ABC transport system ATP-binding protein